MDFDAFVSGRTLATMPFGSSDSMPIVQGGVTKNRSLLAATGIIVAPPPNGVDDTATLNSLFASANGRTVYMPQGIYLVSATVAIPDDAIVVGEERNIYEFYDGTTVYDGKTAIVGINGSSWNGASQYIVSVGKRSLLKGISVRGFHTRGDWPVDGISLLNAMYSYLDHVFVYSARNGYVLGATSTAGSIGNELHYCRASQCNGAGIVSSLSGGGFLSDGKFLFVGIDGCGTGIDINAASWQVVGCRIEQTFSSGMRLQSSANSFLISGNFFDICGDGSIVFVSNNNFNTIVGNRLKSNGGFGEFQFLAGSNLRNVIAGNSAFPSGASSVFYVAPGVTFGGEIYMPDVYNAYISGAGNSGSPNFFLDANTRAALAPFTFSSAAPVAQFVTTLTPASGTFTPDCSFGTSFQITTSHTGTNTVANPTNILTDMRGKLAFVQSATGTDVIAFGGNYVNGTAALATFNTAANAVNILDWWARSPTNIILSKTAS